MFCIHECQGERNYHCILQLALIIVTQVLFYMIILLWATKWKRWTTGSSFALRLHGYPTNVLENQLLNKEENIFLMKENKTVDETFVTSASIRVNYLYKIINETALVYSSACESGSWTHTISIANTPRILALRVVYVHADESCSLP